VISHSFSHLAEEKADHKLAKDLPDHAHPRFQDTGYETTQVPSGFFNDLEITAPGQPLRRIYKKFWLTS